MINTRRGITPEGIVKLDILSCNGDRHWGPALDIRAVVSEIYKLLQQDPFEHSNQTKNTNKLQLYQSFEETAKEWSQKYADAMKPMCKVDVMKYFAISILITGVITYVVTLLLWSFVPPIYFEIVI